jgi:hypothetical protein
MPHFKSDLKKLSNSYVRVELPNISRLRSKWQSLGNQSRQFSRSLQIPLYRDSYGPGKLNIVVTQFRCSATFLNYDLFKVNIISNPSCSCGAIREDSYHYFFECPLYNGIRNDLLNCLDWLPNEDPTFLRVRPFNLNGGVMVFCFIQKKKFGQHKS